MVFLKKPSTGQVDGTFFKGKEVGDKWDMDFRTMRHAGHTQLVIPRFYRKPVTDATEITVPTRSVQQMAVKCEVQMASATGVWEPRNPTAHPPLCLISPSLLGPELQDGKLPRPFLM